MDKLSEKVGEVFFNDQTGKMQVQKVWMFNSEAEIEVREKQG